ncbi:MAG: hypothetical protein J3R72DRAFT_426636 [Linnemannia gamsii]|nr:MAG: hypothetical protein J3R72DRAFT_426636 [Linnemannia gamsii]
MDDLFVVPDFSDLCNQVDTPSGADERSRRLGWKEVMSSRLRIVTALIDPEHDHVPLLSVLIYEELPNTDTLDNITFAFSDTLTDLTINMRVSKCLQKVSKDNETSTQSVLVKGGSSCRVEETLDTHSE